MKKRTSTLVTILLIALLATSTVYAGGNVKLSGKVSLGSLHFDGSMTGLGGYTQGVTIKFTGYGLPVIQCVNNDDGHEEHGLNPAPVQTSTEQKISSSTTVIEKGKAPVGVEITNEEIQASFSSNDGCQDLRKHHNDHDDDDDWTAILVDVQWTKATIDVYNGGDTEGTLLRSQVYKCSYSPSFPNYTSFSCPLTQDISYH
jgi:hypothetical protein